ncbi:xanthine dehydrogenase subunit D [Paenibacillus sp. MMS18-CY102]|uniref:xanthine dehydrogenase subunit D n=1 Tax=Paenibacillus sp. MMS18-CY102 TaxID=2682849 RepID=UPI0013651B40|nr:xanthine dehydrogenase subunit D [Paenibacillus sp. MMS18-CY102]MWC28710.1 xanthine dehydrogenase subunit D [Paenibacillus sp. MMS18-CY102]
MKSQRDESQFTAQAAPSAKLDRDAMGTRWMERPDGRAKVTGRLAYLTDRKSEHMLHGKVLRSRHPHARIIHVDISAAVSMPGVHAVLTAEDVPGLNGYGIVTQDIPVFCTDRVRHVGDVIAAIAAETPEQASAAAEAIYVDYEPLPVVDDPLRALEPDAPQLHEMGNMLHETLVLRGDINAAFAQCAAIVEEVYTTPRQLHLYMETEGGLFVPEEDGRLTVYSATQHGYMDRMQLARILALPESSIRVVSSPIGGSFGGKDELNVQPYGALLAIRTGRPVRLHNSRRESMRASIKRHPMRIRMRTGADAEGKIVAHHTEIVADTGAYATLGREVLQFATEHATGPYRIANVKTEGRSVFTNNGIAGEFRGFGGNQVIFALEGQLDRLAERLGMDAWELRRRNLREADDPGPVDQIIVPTNGARDVWDAALRSSLMARRGQSKQGDAPWLVRGVGAAIVMHGGGLGYGIPDPAGGRLALSADGKIEAAFGFEEFGQGVLSVLQLLVCEHLNCAADDVRIVIGDTDAVPHTGSATASRATAMAWQAMRQLVPPFAAVLLAQAAKLLACKEAELFTGAGGVWRRALTSGQALDQPDLAISYKQLAEASSESIMEQTAFDFPVTPSPNPTTGAHFLYTYASVVVEAEVDLLTGRVQVLQADHYVAAGPVVNPMGYLGQIEGGSAMALGFTLTEEAVMEEGRYARGQLDTYMIPTIRDMPREVGVEAIEQLPAGDPFGPRGVGEIGTVGLAPAIVSAIRAACGSWVNRLPVRPEQLIRPFHAFLKADLPSGHGAQCPQVEVEVELERGGDVHD